MSFPYNVVIGRYIFGVAGLFYAFPRILYGPAQAVDVVEHVVFARFVARLDNGKASVQLCEVDYWHPFYNLEGSNNIILLTTERYKEYPMMIQGYGAGAAVTAAGVFADIMSIANI